MRELVVERARLGTFPTSPLETVVLQMLIDCGLPMPELQHRIFDEEGLVARPDFVYLEQGLVIEAHSRLWHEGKRVRDDDAARDARLRRAGFSVVYVTWPDATQYRDRTASLIARRLEGDSGELTGPERALVLLS